MFLVGLTVSYFSIIFFFCSWKFLFKNFTSAESNCGFRLFLGIGTGSDL
jgi:hypothetical protein